MPQEPQQATGWPWNWRAAAAIVCMLHMLGISGAVIAAALEIESIVVTGPIFSLLGIGVAIGSRASRSISNAAFGLSTLAMTLACTGWIVALSWSPGDAQIPVTAVLICYELLILPLACLALYRTLAPPGSGSPQASHRWQFSIAQLLTVTTLLAIVMGVGKAAIQYGAGTQLAIAIALCNLTLLGVATASFKGLALPEETGDLDSDQPTQAAVEAAGDTTS